MYCCVLFSCWQFCWRTSGLDAIKFCLQKKKDWRSAKCGVWTHDNLGTIGDDWCIVNSKHQPLRTLNIQTQWTWDKASRYTYVHFFFFTKHAHTFTQTNRTKPHTTCTPIRVISFYLFAYGFRSLLELQLRLNMGSCEMPKPLLPFINELRMRWNTRSNKSNNICSIVKPFFLWCVPWCVHGILGYCIFVHILYSFLWFDMSAWCVFSCRLAYAKWNTHSNPDRRYKAIQKLSTTDRLQNETKHFASNHLSKQEFACWHTNCIAQLNTTA